MGRTARGWTLAELLIVVAVLGLLGSLAVPSLHQAREYARLTSCAAGLHDLHIGLIAYAASNQRRLPPFAFSDSTQFNIPLSGHWGGASQTNDPSAFGRKGVNAVNLWALVKDGQIPPAVLICAGADGALAGGQASLFPYSFRFSTYCMRMPDSADLFADAPGLYTKYGMNVYAFAAGGQRLGVGTQYETVPQVRMDRQYSLADGSTFDPASDVILADGFWRQDYQAGANPTAGLTAYPVHDGWRHGSRFNVLTGRGTVQTVDDDGTAAANSVPAGGSLTGDGAYMGSYAQRIWAFFDKSR